MWTTSRYSQTESSGSSSLRWNMGESSSTQPWGGQDTLERSSKPRVKQPSSGSIAIRSRWKRHAPTSKLSVSAFGLRMTTSRNLRPYWNDSGLRRLEASYSISEFPHPNSMSLDEVSASDTKDPSTCAWIPFDLSRRTTW